MEVPSKIFVDLPPDRPPTGYYDTTRAVDDYDDDEDETTPKIRLEPATKLMSPPKTLTAIDISEEERRRYMRDNSFNNAHVNYVNDESLYKTPSDVSFKNLNVDPSGITRQVKHLHNRVRLLEVELQAQHNRQVLLIGFVTLYMVSRCLKWLYR